MSVDDADEAPGAAAPLTEPPRPGRALGRLRASIPWWAALREFAIIVAGVLAALGAQAWWQGREALARERDSLRGLLADTRENERRLDDAIAQDSATRAEVGRLAAALYGPGPLPPNDTLVA